MEIREFLTKYFHFTDEELIQKTLECAHVVDYKSGSIYINQGEPYQYVGFLMIDGLMGGYFTTPNGKKAYECFVYHAGQGGLVDYYPPKPEGSSITWIVIEDSTVLRIPLEAVPELMKYPERMAMVLSQFIESNEFHAKTKEITVSYNADEKIHQFELAFPKLNNRLSAPMVASLLGSSERTYYRAKEKAHR